MSFHLALLGPSGAHWLDDAPNVTALLVCCGLAATGLTALLDRPRSRGQVPVVGLAGLIAIPLFWTSLTRPVPAPQAEAGISNTLGSVPEAEGGIASPEGSAPETATTVPKLSTVTVGRTVQIGVFRIRVTAMTCGYAKVADLGTAERGQYCVVQLTATNIRSSPNVPGRRRVAVRRSPAAVGDQRGVLQGLRARGPAVV
jgi:hypothetical protein